MYQSEENQKELEDFQRVAEIMEGHHTTPEKKQENEVKKVIEETLKKNKALKQNDRNKLRDELFKKLKPYLQIIEESKE